MKLTDGAHFLGYRYTLLIDHQIAFIELHQIISRHASAMSINVL